MKAFLYVLVSLGIAAPSIQAAEPPVTAVAFTPDGESLVAASQSGLRVLSWPELKPLRSVKTSMANLHALAFSPDGKQLAVGGGHPSEDGTVEIFSWPAGEPVATLTGHEDSVLAVVWRGPSELLSASLDREIKLWDLRTKKPRLKLTGHSRGVSTLRLLKDGNTLVSSGEDQSVRVWDLESGELARGLNQHTGPVRLKGTRDVEPQVELFNRQVSTH